MQPETHYAQSGDVQIAYQVIGNGASNFVVVPGYIANLDHMWDEPGRVHFLTGSGLSFTTKGRTS